MQPLDQQLEIRTALAFGQLGEIGKQVRQPRQAGRQAGSGLSVTWRDLYRRIATANDRYDATQAVEVCLCLAPGADAGGGDRGAEGHLRR
jgi:hypothetical protein